MHALRNIFLCLALTIESVVAQFGTQVFYGKYYSNYVNPAVKDFTDNSYFLYLPPKNLPNMAPGTTAPIVMHLYGNGWKLGMGPKQYGSPKIAKMVSNGIAVASVGYRRITCQYWYDLQGQRLPEEFINIDANGVMSLDATGKTFKDYVPRVARHEYLTKPTFDVTQALEHLISNAVANSIDPHRLYLWCFSAGGTMGQYVTYVYHQWNSAKFTPKGMTYDACMLELPTANILDHVWALFAANMVAGPSTLLKDLITQDMCWWVVGSGCGDSRFAQWFSPDLPYTTCNATWNQVALQTYCGPSFYSVTIGQLMTTQTWLEDTPFAQGLARIWYAARNMIKYTPKPFHVFLDNGADEYGLLHSPVYSAEFKKVFDQVGVQYAMYYDTIGGLVEPVGAVQAIPGKVTYKYVSNDNWQPTLNIAGWSPGVWTESVWYACFALEQASCSPSFAVAVTTAPTAVPTPIPVRVAVAVTTAPTAVTTSAPPTVTPVGYLFVFNGACLGAPERTQVVVASAYECSLKAKAPPAATYFSFSKVGGVCALYDGVCTAGDTRPFFTYVTMAASTTPVQPPVARLYEAYDQPLLLL